MAGIVLSDRPTLGRAVALAATAKGKSVLVTKDALRNGGFFTYSVAPALDFLDCVTSALVRVNGIVVRTLWANIVKPAGEYFGRWDFRDDEGNLLTLVAADQVQVEVCQNNLAYTWGHWGNNSTASTGPSIHRGGDPNAGIYRIDVTRFGYNEGFGEGAVPASGWDISDFHTRIDTATLNGGIGLTRDYAKVLGNRTFNFGFDPYERTKTDPPLDMSYCYATDNTTGEKVVFSAGVVGPIRTGTPYDSVIGLLHYADSRPTGLALGSNCAWLSRPTGVMVCDSDSGALLHSLPISGAGASCVDGDKYWLAKSDYSVSRYTILADKTISAVELTLPDQLEVLDMQVLENELWLLCGGEVAPVVHQNFRVYDAATGIYLFSRQQEGGNVTSAVVNDQTLLLRANYDNSAGRAVGGFDFTADGNYYYVTNPANWRTTKYTRAGDFVEHLYQQPRNYNVWPVKNSVVGNKSRLLCLHKEYEIDHEQTDHRLGLTPVDNLEMFQLPGFEGQPLMYPTKFPSGRVFGLMQNVNSYGYPLALIERIQGVGYRFVRDLARNVALYEDFTIRFIDVEGREQKHLRRACLDSMAESPDFAAAVAKSQFSLTDSDEPHSDENFLPGEEFADGTSVSWSPRLYYEEESRYHLLFEKDGRIVFRGKKAMPQHPQVPFQRNNNFRTCWQRENGGILSGGTSTSAQVIAGELLFIHNHDEFEPSDANANVLTAYFRTGHHLGCYGQTSRERHNDTTVENACGNGKTVYAIYLPLLGRWCFIFSGETSLGTHHISVTDASIATIKVTIIPL